MQNARDVASTNPGMIEPKSIYRIGEGGNVIEITGEQLLSQATKAGDAANYKSQEYRDYYEFLLDQGTSAQRAKFLADAKYGSW
ncbi:hypothetical protein M3M33_14455, partial [Loigolactobacillus coryniformis]|uniref:hypothetical protein n=1 Tax=Loigolactobacillus coryniformis TaxID=1610 RepID=UPI00201AD9DB